MEITEVQRQRAIRILSEEGYVDAENVMDAVLNALAGPSAEVLAGAEALRQWKGCNVHIDHDADLEEIAEVVLNTVTIPEPTPHNDQAMDLLAHALPRIKELLNWFADRSGRTVIQDGTYRAMMWASRINRLQLALDLNPDLEWLPQHVERLSYLTGGE